MPSRSGSGRGTLELRRVFGGRIRIRVASGTRELRRFHQLDAMLLDLWESGHADILEAIRDGVLTPLEVFPYWRRREVHRLPSAELLVPLDEAWRSWLEGVTGEAHRRAARRTLALLLTVAPAPVLVAHLATALLALRKSYAHHPRTVNLARAHAQAFVRDTLTRAHRLYVEVQAVPTLTVRRSASISAPRPTEVATWAGMLPPARAAELWSMYLTGMGRKEYWEDGFVVHADRVEIRGLKRRGRHRVVPLVGAPVPPGLSVKRWSETIRAVIDAPNCTPHGLRRGFAHLCELARIPPSRIRLYLGHGMRSVTDLYTSHEIDPYLPGDRAALRDTLAGFGIHPGKAD
jgi:integrase